MKYTYTVEGETEAEMQPYTRAMDWHCLAVDWANWLREQEKYGTESTWHIHDIRAEFHRRLAEMGLEV